MNRKLLLKVRDTILEDKYPTIMDSWFALGSKDADKKWGFCSHIRRTNGAFSELPESEMTHIPSHEYGAQYGCKTAGCIAGHAIMEVYGNKPITYFKKIPGAVERTYVDEDTGKTEYELDYAFLGQKALKLDEEEADLLFYTYNWPDLFTKSYEAALEDGDYKRVNKVVAHRIDWFLDFGE